MNYAVVDTNVVSYLLKKHAIANLYRPHLEGRVLTVSFMTVAELYLWAFKRNWGPKKREELEATLRNYAVIPFDNDLCVSWAKITAEGDKVHRSIACADAWIAASALQHKIPLVTHNPKHFEFVPGLELITETS